VDKIDLGRRYDVLEWLKEGLRALVNTEGKDVKEEEFEEAGRVLGWETMARVSRLRESSSLYAPRCSAQRCSKPDTLIFGRIGTIAQFSCNICTQTLGSTLSPGRIRDEDIRKAFLGPFEAAERQAAGTR
jgi:hypothetical protein